MGGQPRGRKVATYLYTDVMGTPKIRKIRYENKNFPTFFATSVDPDSGLMRWSPRKHDGIWPFCIKALYKLPEVVAALRVHDPVWWCEGEKDAENVAATGLVATTTPTTSEIYDSQAEWFTKFNTRSEVVVVCDQDQHGGWWGWQRYVNLVRMGVEPDRIRIVAPPWRPPFMAKGTDVSDVLEAGLSLGDLRSVEPERLRECAAQYRASRAQSYMGFRPAPKGKGSR